MKSLSKGRTTMCLIFLSAIFILLLLMSILSRVTMCVDRDIASFYSTNDIYVSTARDFYPFSQDDLSGNRITYTHSKSPLYNPLYSIEINVYTKDHTTYSELVNRFNRWVDTKTTRFIPYGDQIEWTLYKNSTSYRCFGYYDQNSGYAVVAYGVNSEKESLHFLFFSSEEASYTAPHYILSEWIE